MPVDLHVHSTSSDGSATPEQLARIAAEAGLSTFALTDHDTQAGVVTARRAAAEWGVEVIPGVELSLDWDRGGMHLVVLFLEPGPGPLQDRLADLRAGRHRRNARIVEILAELGIDISLEEVMAVAGGESVGRPHLATLLVRKGVVADLTSAFDQYLAKGRPAYADRARLGPEEAIGLARASGAVSVLAHPHTLGLDRAEEVGDLLERLGAAGLVGLECYYATYEADQRAELADTARRFGLVPSGGSDYHGEYKPGIELGKGRGDLAVAVEVVDELAAARPPGPRAPGPRPEAGR